MPRPAAPDVLLCERCGYPLDGHAYIRDATCPECGLDVHASHPDRRTPTAWHRRPGPATLTRTVTALARHPRSFFRGLGFAGSNNPERVLLLLSGSAAGALAGLDAWLIADRLPVQAWLIGMLTTQAVLILSVVEVLGVAFFSRRRGWRVPLKHAERIVAYASPAWLPTTALLLLLIHAAGGPDGLAARLPPLPLLTTDQSAGALALAAVALALCCFEWVVYLGVRQARFANTAATVTAGRPADPT